MIRILRNAPWTRLAGPEGRSLVCGRNAALKGRSCTVASALFGQRGVGFFGECGLRGRDARAMGNYFMSFIASRVP